MKLIMTRGLPASGKTTWAKEFVASQPTGSWKRVNKDDMRAMLDAGKWSKKNEEYIIQIRDCIVGDCLSSGSNVIVDDTNLHPKHEARLREIADKLNAEFEVKVFDADVYECIERDAKRANGVGKSVIWRMWQESIIPRVKWPANRHDLPKAIICDLDGTLADIGHRNPYNASTCEQDGFNYDIATILQRTVPMARIIFVSGRSEEFRPQTEAWLLRYGLYKDAYYDLFMRQKDDKRKDWLVKFEILRDSIMPHFDPVMVLDDRDQVVAMWRAQGLRCLQVADGNF